MTTFLQSLRWIPFITLLEREVRRFAKVAAQTLITPIVNSSLYLLIFGVSLGQSIEMKGDLTYLGFLIPGLVMMGCLNNSFQNSSSSIVGAKFGGDLEDYKVSCLSNYQIIWAMAFGGLFRGILVGAITFAVGQGFYFFVEDQWMAIHAPLTLMFFLTVGGLSFAMLGLSVAFWAKTFDQLAVVGGFILLPLIYLGGVFFSIESLHPFWQKVSQFNPLLYLINGVRYGILGVSDVTMASAVVVALGTLTVFFMVALRSLRTSSFIRW